MDEKDLEMNQPQPEMEFDLDEIMKEFAPEEGEALPEEVEALSRELSEEESPEDPDDDMIIAGEPTVKLPDVEKEEAAAPQPVSGDTIRLDKLDIEAAPPTVVDAIPIPEDEDIKEPFSEQWEPEYEQPMGEYIPPQPIQFQPRSRLRELKRQLVAGPEKRYYQLAEKGVGKLQVLIFLSIVVALLSAASTVLFAFGAVPEDRLRLMIFGQFLAMLVSALLGSFQLIEGVAELCKGRFTLKTLLVFTLIACGADGILCLQELRVPCCAAFSLEVTLALFHAYQIRSAEMGQMDTMRKAVRLDSLNLCPDYHEGRNGFLRGEGQVEDFMDHYHKTSGPQKILNWYALGALVASVAIGVVAALFNGISAGVQVAAVCLLAATPATIYVTLSRPMAILTRRLHAVGAVICGWQGIRGLAGKGLFPVDYADLFPAGSARMNGVKFYGSRQPDEIVAYCTAVITANGSGLTPIFTQVLDSRNGRRVDAEELRTYGNGGIGASVEGNAVLVGSLEFLKEMGVEVPEGIRVNQAVCVAIDGELCGLFALTYEVNRAASAGLSSLCSSRKAAPVFATDDFLLTEDFMASRFSAKTRRMVFPDPEVRQQLREKTAQQDRPALALATRNALTSYAYCISGARALKTASWIGTIIHLLGGIVGLGAMVTLVLLGRLDLLTPMNMFAYQLVWMIPGFLITEWTRAC